MIQHIFTDVVVYYRLILYLVINQHFELRTTLSLPFFFFHLTSIHFIFAHSLHRITPNIYPSYNFYKHSTLKVNKLLVTKK